jgi:hypothetical protein
MYFSKDRREINSMRDLDCVQSIYTAIIPEWKGVVYTGYIFQIHVTMFLKLIIC